MRRRPFPARAAAVVAALAASAAGCGGDDSGVVDVGAAPGRPTTSVAGTAPPTTAPPATATTVPSTTPTSVPATGGGPATTPPPVPTTAATTTVTLWLVRGEAVEPVTRAVPAVEGIGAEAVRALLAGPTADEVAQGFGTAIPPGTRLLGLDIDAAVATVDLSSEYESGGGSASVTLRLAQVVCTLDAFPTVDAVAFHLDGQPVSVFSGEGVVLDGPVSCADYGDTGAPSPDGAAEDGFAVANAVESFLAGRQAGGGWESWITEDAVGAYEANPDDELRLVPVSSWTITSIAGSGPYEVFTEVDGHVEVLVVRSGLALDGTRRDVLVTGAQLG